MKRPVQMLLVIPLLSLAVFGCAPIIEGVASGAAEATTEEALESFGVFDNDDSGEISRAEYDEHAGSFDDGRTFDAYDANGDGFISEEEFDGYEG